MNINQLLEHTQKAIQNTPELKMLEKHMNDLQSSTTQLQAEMQLLLTHERELPETLGIVSSVLENVATELKNCRAQHQELEMTVLTKHFVSPLVEALHQTLPYPTRVQLDVAKEDLEIQIELLNPEGVQKLTLVPDFKEGRVLFVANPTLCNLSPLGTLTNAFGHELLVAPAELDNLVKLAELA